MILASHQSPVGAHLLNVARHLNLRRPFNPAIISLNDNAILTAIRSIGERFGIMTTIVVSDPLQSRIDAAVDVSAANRHFGIPRTNDARLFSMGEQVMMTFNTGHPDVRSEQNSIYVQAVYPILGCPIELHISRRQRVEKNILFRQVGAQLWASYRFGEPEVPVRIGADKWTIEPLQEDWGAVGSERKSEVLTRRVHWRSYGQGTPWLPHEGSILSVVNERIHWGGFRSYRGRVVVQSHRGHAILRTPLYHSRMSRLGPVRRHNPRLLHCTYFLGLTHYRERILASYGINDQGFGVAELSGDCVGN